jgi:hypothetical protein
MKISQNVVAFSEYMNFTLALVHDIQFEETAIFSSNWLYLMIAKVSEVNCHHNFVKHDGCHEHNATE